LADSTRATETADEQATLRGFSGCRTSVQYFQLRVNNPLARGPAAVDIAHPFFGFLAAALRSRNRPRDLKSNAIRLYLRDCLQLDEATGFAAQMRSHRPAWRPGTLIGGPRRRFNFDPCASSGQHDWSAARRLPEELAPQERVTAASSTIIHFLNLRGDSAGSD